MLFVWACRCPCPIHWSHVLIREWRCSWSSAGRRCSNYICLINKLIAYWGTSYIRCLTVPQVDLQINYINLKVWYTLNIMSMNTFSTKHFSMFEHIWTHLKAFKLLCLKYEEFIRPTRIRPVASWDPLYYHGLREIKAWTGNYIHCFQWDVITPPCPITMDLHHDNSRGFHRPLPICWFIPIHFQAISIHFRQISIHFSATFPTTWTVSPCLAAVGTACSTATTWALFTSCPSRPNITTSLTMGGSRSPCSINGSRMTSRSAP